MGSETTYFVVLTIVLAFIGFMMPYVIEIGTGQQIEIESPSGLAVVSIKQVNAVSGAGLTDNVFTKSLARAFFWYYGELFLIGNIIKGIINVIWIYLLVRLARGGG